MDMNLDLGVDLPPDMWVVIYDLLLFDRPIGAYSAGRGAEWCGRLSVTCRALRPIWQRLILQRWEQPLRVLDAFFSEWDPMADDSRLPPAVFAASRALNAILLEGRRAFRQWQVARGRRRS